EKNKVGAEDMKKILAAVDSYRKEIVQPKKPEEKKPEEQKPLEKKPVDKKPVEKKPGTTANITGKVRYKGVSLTCGTITFSGEKSSVKCAITDDGAYIAKVKPGTYRVAITTPVVLAPALGAKPPAELKNVRKIVRIPAKYGDSDKSGLTYAVKEGRQTFDIDLK
ncbi:MAG: hypothetical protein ACRELG_18150, partial [Gemmataceae bacterium]